MISYVYFLGSPCSSLCLVETRSALAVFARALWAYLATTEARDVL